MRKVFEIDATSRLTYARLPRFATADGKGTNDPTKALQASNGQLADTLCSSEGGPPERPALANQLAAGVA